MVSDLPAFEAAAFLQFYSSFIYQLLEETGMMNYFVMAAELRILILKCVETMRTGCDDFFDAISVKHLDILVSHHLEQELVSCPSRRIAGTHFFFSEYSEIYLKLI